MSTDKIIKGRKYGVIINNEELRIERKVKDIFDTVGMGFNHLRMNAEAIGEIDRKKEEINLIVKLKSIWENGLIVLALFLILGLIILLISFTNLQETLFLGLGALIPILIIYGLLKFGLDEFKFDLERDLKYIESNP